VSAGPAASPRGATLRAFHRPLPWLGLWIVGWALCIGLSLMHPPDLGIDMPDDSDKLGHFLAYGMLAAWAVWLFRGTRAQAVSALGLVSLGIALEFAQGAWTVDRMMDWNDGVADAVGVLAGLGLARWLAPGFLQWVDARLFRAPGDAD
jgi:hypothetical protein